MKQKLQDLKLFAEEQNHLTRLSLGDVATGDVTALQSVLERIKEEDSIHKWFVISNSTEAKIADVAYRLEDHKTTLEVMKLETANDKEVLAITKGVQATMNKYLAKQYAVEDVLVKQIANELSLLRSYHGMVSRIRGTQKTLLGL